MTDHERRTEVDSGTDDARGRVVGTDTYAVEDGVVLFDINNPLAWLEADDAVRLTEAT